jgi:tartrate-resistant acid phosphatase type 5
MLRALTLCTVSTGFAAAADAAASGLHFLAMGDWGGQDAAPYTEKGQAESAVAMATVAGKIGASFALGMGDNFYGSGIHGDEHDARFQETFENVYTGSSLNIPFYMIAGNHDHKGNVTAQIAYSADSTRWEYPAPYYAIGPVAFNTSSGKAASFQMFMIDTVVWAGNSDDLSPASGRASKFDALGGTAPHHAALQDAQSAWLKAQLEASTATHLWVGGHYPVYSAGSHGPTPALISDVLPLLKAHGAHYVCGHDHMLEHISDAGVEHILTGAGDNCCYGQDNDAAIPAGSLKFITSSKSKSTIEGGFVAFNLDDETTIDFYDQSGKVIYSTPKIAARKR